MNLKKRLLNKGGDMNPIVSAFAEKRRQLILTIGLFIGLLWSVLWLLDVVADWIMVILQSRR
jgi:hypothetical protein